MILFDSGPLLAYVNDKDPHHKASVDLMTVSLKGVYGKLLVTNYIVDEVLTLALVRTRSCKYGEEILKVIRSEKGEKKIFYEVIIQNEMITKTEELFRKYCSKGLSFTDCSLLAVSEILNVEYLATFSAEFKGLATILPE